MEFRNLGLINNKETNEIIRQTIIVGANIYYKPEIQKTFRLKEEKQVFKDGRERIRVYEQSLAEKMKPDEKVMGAIIRGIREELGIDGDINILENGSYEKIKKSVSYPGLKSSFLIYDFKVPLDEKQYKEDGYVEEQEDKTTYFVWEEIKKSQ